MITKVNKTVLDLTGIDSFDMGGNRITNVGAPILGTDVANQDFVLTQSFLPVAGGVMTGNIDMNGGGIVNLVDPINPQDVVNLQFLQDNIATQGYLNDPPITRDSADSFTVGVYQASPLTAVTPIATATSSVTRQLTNLFSRATVGLKGIVENKGAFAIPALTTNIDISFSGSPGRIGAGSGTPFSTYSAGDKVIVSGSALNDGVYDVSVATATTIDTVQTLITELAGATISIFRVAQSSTYHMFAVFETGVGTVDVAVDDNISGSNIGSGVSAGWEMTRRLWSFVLDSSSGILAFTKIGNYCFWDVPQVFTPADPVSIAVPDGIRTIAGVTLTSTWSGAGARISSLYLTGGTTPPLNTSTAWGYLITTGGAPSPIVGHGIQYIGTNTSRQISVATTGTGSIAGSCQAYIDERKE